VAAGRLPARGGAGGGSRGRSPGPRRRSRGAGRPGGFWGDRRARRGRGNAGEPGCARAAGGGKAPLKKPFFRPPCRPGRGRAQTGGQIIPAILQPTLPPPPCINHPWDSPLSWGRCRGASGSKANRGMIVAGPVPKHLISPGRSLLRQDVVVMRARSWWVRLDRWTVRGGAAGGGGRGARPACLPAGLSRDAPPRLPPDGGDSPAEPAGGGRATSPPPGPRPGAITLTSSGRAPPPDRSGGAQQFPFGAGAGTRQPRRLRRSCRPRCVGPPRAGHFSLRAHVDQTRSAQPSPSQAVLASFTYFSHSAAPEGLQRLPSAREQIRAIPLDIARRPAMLDGGFSGNSPPRCLPVGGVSW
jgi:hypothetical protein